MNVPAWCAALLFGCLCLAACDADRTKDLETKSDALQRDNDSLRQRVKDLEAQVSTLEKERDALKTAPPPVAAPPPDATASTRATPEPLASSSPRSSHHKRKHR